MINTKKSTLHTPNKLLKIKDKQKILITAIWKEINFLFKVKTVDFSKGTMQVYIKRNATF